MSILPLVAPPQPRKALSIRPVDVLYIVGTHTISGRKALRAILVVLAAIPLLALFHVGARGVLWLGSARSGDCARH